MSDPPLRRATPARGPHRPGTDLFPVSLDLAGRACLVVGAGRIAARKAQALLAAGAKVTVVAPAIGPEMARLNPITLWRRGYGAGDAAGFWLVITATGVAEVDGAVYADAEAAGVWVNSADDPANCSFILPSVHRDGPVTIAVSTSGRSPALATWLRTRVAVDYGQHVGALAELLGRARSALAADGRSTETIDWITLLDGPLPQLVAKGHMQAARELVESATGVKVGPP